MQKAKLYVGNLTYSVTEDQLRELFSRYGEVVSVNILEGKGFGFVEMGSEEEAMEAKKALNGQEFEGRVMRIDNARPPRHKRRRNFRNNNR